jgi:hypothetical protein
MNAPTPETKYALSVILEEHGELCEETAPFILVRLCKKLEHDITELNLRLIDRQQTLMEQAVKLQAASRLLTRCRDSAGRVEMGLYEDIQNFLNS